MMPCLGFKHILNNYTFEAGSSREEGVEGRLFLLVASSFLVSSL